MKLKDKIKIYFLNKKLNLLNKKLKVAEINLEHKENELAVLDKKFETIEKTKSDRLNIEFLLSDIEYYANMSSYLNKEINDVLAKIGVIKYGKQCNCEECQKNRINNL